MGQETKEAFAVLVNTDLTEGRGRQYIKHICETEATARRLAEKADVQGTNGTVITVALEKRNAAWFGPVNVIPANDADKKAQTRLDAIRDAEQKALSLGLTPDDIAILRRAAQ